MEFEDKTLTCTGCGAAFIFSRGEQQFFSERHLVNIPKRCQSCRLALRFARTGRDVQQLSEVMCADCQKSAKVPFKPRGHSPVYCNDCLAERRKVVVSSLSSAMSEQADTAVPCYISDGAHPERELLAL